MGGKVWEVGRCQTKKDFANWEFTLNGIGGYRRIWHVHGLENSAIVKLSVLPKVIYRFRAISIKTLARIFVQIDKLILRKKCIELQKAKNSQSNYENEELEDL